MNQPISPQVSPKIRVIALGLISDGSRLFVSEGYDAVRRFEFYRALGGGIEFGETSLEALKREFWEEIQAELTNIQYLGCLENLFAYAGMPKHELIQLYRCDFADPMLYQTEAVKGNDNGNEFTARWIECDRFLSGELALVPAQCLNFLNSR